MIEKEVSFKVNCEPTAQERVRYTSVNHIAYKSKTQRINEETLELSLNTAKRYCFEGVTLPIEGRVGIEIIACLPIPKSVSKIQRIRMASGQVWPEKKPDIDNLIKQILDAMTRLGFWVDDKQVVVCNAVKQYSEDSCWYIKLFPVRSYYGHRECV